MLNLIERMNEAAAYKNWRRAVNASRREVVKFMEKAGYRPNVWVKRDKGRTIMQVWITDKDGVLLLQRTIKRINLKWAARLVSPRGTQEMVCWDLGAEVKGMGQLYTLMHCDPSRVEDNCQFAQFGRKG